MVSSSTISGDAGKIKEIFSDYSNYISTLNSGIWEGRSQENAISQMQNFLSQFQNTINTQMSNFESAVSKYNEFQKAKQKKEEATKAMEREIQNANAADREPNTTSYKTEITNAEEVMRRLKPEITQLLSTVKSAKLDIEATAIEPGTFTLGDFVNYYQGDYSNVSYGSGSIANCGCGPTSMSMVLTYLTGETVDPPAAAAYATNRGHYVWGSGTSWEYYADIASNFGIECEQSEPNANKLVEDLSNGKTMIMSMAPGHFTRGGHFIVLRGLTPDGKIIVADPASRERSSRVWDVSTVVGESKQMWSFSGDNLKEFVI